MKSILLSLALLSAPLLIADVTESENVIHDMQATAEFKDSAATDDSDAMNDQNDEEDDLMDADIPDDMIEQPKPVSDFEAYWKGIGVQLLMKYITFKIWLEHLMDSKA